ncbi:MAG: SCP2 sterol-binding domain-containing protein [Desulfobacterota bacterium]|nr:SCP2 sterol-binding domain-containing protein [Thermodesulfobacteriota bacterium]
MAEYFGVKVEDIFNTMQERFRPEGAQGVDASFGYDITGEGKWKLTVRDEKMTIEQTGDLSGCAVVTVTDGETFVGVNIGKVDGMSAFSSGKFKAEGDLGALGKTAKMFRKFVPLKKEMSIRDYLMDMFGTVASRFKAGAAEGVDVVFAFDLGGEYGGKWSVIIKDKTCRVIDRIEGKPTVKLEFMDAKDYVDFSLGKIDAQSLLAAGRAAVAGEINLALKWAEFFDKYVDPMGSGEKEQELLVLKKTISVEQRYATGPVMGKFLNGLKDKKIIGLKCSGCGKIMLPAVEVCADCRVRASEWVEVGPKGQVRYMEYVYYASPDPLTGETRETPYGMLNILLDGCKGNETFAHLVRRDQIDRIQNGWNEASGTRVRPVWSKNRTGSIHDIEYFEIDE